MVTNALPGLRCMHANAYPTRKPLLAFLGLTVLVVLVELLITRHRQFTTVPALPLAVTFDLVVGLPLLYYFCLVRPYRLSPFTLTGAFVAAVALATVVLPAPQQTYLAWVRQSWVLAEPLLGLLMLWRLRSLIRAYRLARSQQPDLALNLEAAFQTVFGTPLRPVVGEILMLRYGLFFWLRAPEPGCGQRFTVHRESAFVAILGTLLLVTVAEALAVHFLVVRWSYGAAVVLLVLSLYSLIFLVGHLAAALQKPVVVDADYVRIRVGLVWSFTVPRAAIARAELLRDPDKLPAATLNLAKPLLTPPNVLLTCHVPITVTGIYGLRTTTCTLALYVDAPQDFVGILTTAIRTTSA
ncbi:hypothetical protein [Hymenobacter cellulosilyticus]|uniref:Uncharacterized protein n=1 Tax=Hymenobacter cellulosilyticus TaxID=2932248 RepID=A0A8T9Q3K9_9BACT|nr:hypothetical protein [Hymenobacter cellulosilyticus]UOQ72134.1 hypothetical protein MUN79_26805 [Hymenobacter cellulosilyticus]